MGNGMTVGTATDPEEIRALLVRQLHSPVRWVETIQRLADEGVTTLVEAGPGKVLAGLTKRIDKRLVPLAVFDAEGLATALEVTEDA